MKTLVPDSRDWRQEYVEGGEYQSNAEGLADFISVRLLPQRIRIEKEIRHVEAIKAQTLGEGLHAHRLENLSRYDTRLDRKFERTLAMLLKLKELRTDR